MDSYSYELKALREEGLMMLSTMEDGKFLEQIITMIRQRYMQEIVDIGPDGKPMSRQAFLAVMDQASESIDRGEGISDEEMEKWMVNLPEDE